MSAAGALLGPSTGVDGDTLTAGNSGFTQVVGLTGNSAVLSTAARAVGAFGARVATGATSSVVYGELNFPTGSSLQFAASGVVTLPTALPGTTMTMLSVRNTSPTKDKIVSIVYQTDGSILAADANTTYQTLVPAGAAIPGGMYRLQVEGTIGTTTSNGTYTAKVFNEFTGAQIGSTVTIANANLTTGYYAGYARLGISTPVASGSLGIANLQIADGTITAIPDLPAPADALLTHFFEGQPAGTAATSQNSDDFGDSPLALVSLSGASSITYASDQPAHGSRSLKIAPASGATAYVGDSFPAAKQLSHSFAFMVTGLPSATMTLGQTYSAGFLGQLVLKADGTIYVTNPKDNTTVATSPAGLIVPNHQYRVDQFVQIGPNGRVLTTVSDLNSATPLWTGDSGTTGIDTGSVFPTGYRLGKVSGTGSLGLLYVDDIRVDPTGSGLLGPYAAPPQQVGVLTQPTAVLDVSASPGTLTHTISPTTGVTAVAGAPGVWVIAAAGTYTVTSTDTSTGLSTAVAYAVDPYAGMVEIVTMNADHSIT